MSLEVGSMASGSEALTALVASDSPIFLHPSRLLEIRVVCHRALDSRHRFDNALNSIPSFDLLLIRTGIFSRTKKGHGRC